MNPEQILSQLRGLHEPIPPSWWPLGIGWWISLTLAVLLIMATQVFIKWLIRSTAKKRAAKKLFKKIVDEFAIHPDKNILARNIAELFKRILLAEGKQCKMARLTQTDLVMTLQAQNKKCRITPELKELLELKIYQHNADFDAATVIASTQAWIKTL